MTKKSGKTVSAKAVAKPVAVSSHKSGKPRRLKRPKYKSLRLQKRIKHHIKLPSVYRLTKKSFRTVWDQKVLFIGIILIYGVLNLILVQGIAGSTDTATLKETLDQVFTGHFAGLASGLSIFTIMLSSAGNSTSQVAGAYQMFLALMGSLAIIWALREVLAGKNVRIRDPYYRGMYPLVPFILIMCVVALQLIPLLIGSGLYSIVVNNGIAVLFIEKFVWAMLYGLLALLTLYMLTSSIFALYIVTLPDMTPLKALRSARELVRYRRWTVLRKIICLPIILLTAAALIMIPIIVWLTPLAQWAFFVLTMSALLAVHAYMYTLYRELLND